MVAIPAPASYPYPQPTDAVAIGFSDPSFQYLKALRRASVTALVPSDGLVTQYDPATGEPSQVYAYGVAVTDKVDSPYGVVIAAFDNQSERRQFIIDNAAAWLS